LVFFDYFTFFSKQITSVAVNIGGADGPRSLSVLEADIHGGDHANELVII